MEARPNGSGDKNSIHTETRKNNNLCTLLHTYVLNTFLTADRSWTTNFF